MVNYIFLPLKYLFSFLVSLKKLEGLKIGIFKGRKNLFNYCMSNVLSIESYTI